MLTGKRRRGDTAAVVSKQGGGDPWRDETQERIGSHRRLNPADRSTDFRTGLKPLKTRPTPPVPLRAVPKPLLGATQDATRRRRNGSGSDDAPRRARRQRRQEGKGDREVSRQFGRETL
jgi:hypothetical protein